MAATSRIALFGGTFDPVHLGHLAMAKAACETLKIDEIRFLPCRISPHKQDTPPSSGEHRLEMLRLATRAFDWATVDDFELHQAEPSYSWATAEAMQKQFPDSQLFWIMGSDQWQALDRWNQPKRLATCVEFIVFHRGNTPQAREDYRMHALDAVHPANATAIRKSAATGTTGHEWLDPKVADYMEEHGLYRGPIS